MTAVADEVVLEIKRIFAAAPGIVFDAWFEREQWQAWIGPEGTYCEVPLLEPHLGGRYRINMNLSDGRRIPVIGVFKTVERPSHLAFTWGWEGEGRESLVTLTFRAVDGGTEMTLRHDGLETLENRDGHGRGWNSALNKLVKYLEFVSS